MSLRSRIANVFRRDRLARELEEEMQSHIDEAIEQGRDPEEARRAFGSALCLRDESSDIKLLPWLDTLRADLVFGFRQIWKSKTTSAAAILSLALAVGACTAAFRLIDALLLRPLPVAGADRLYVLTYEFRDRDQKAQLGDSFDYPSFTLYRDAVKDKAEMLAISYAGRIDITYGSDREMERAHRQWVSGWMFESFGLKPALGRLLNANDDQKAGGGPYAVLSHDYWQSRFGGEPNVLGKTFRAGGTQYEVVGVVEKGFTGTERGTMTDIFVPATMNTRAVDNPNWQWFRAWVKLRPGASETAVRDQLQASFSSYRKEYAAKNFLSDFPDPLRQEFLEAPVSLQSAAAGFSGMQKTYRQSLLILSVLVGLVLLIACVNIANLLTAQATSRERELALRVSIGAGRRRLVQLMLAESSIIGLAASFVGAIFAWWAAPFVVNMINPPDNPARFDLPADWRIFAFITAIAFAVTILLGLAPALRASAIKPVNALKGGTDPHARRKLMHGMVAAQVAFCFLVHFVAGLFVSSFDRLANQPVGFSTDRLLAVEVVSAEDRPTVAWEQLVAKIRNMPDVESAALCTWAPMANSVWASSVWINGHRPDDVQSPYFLGIDSEWPKTMGTQLLDGRAFREEEINPGAAIVNQAFARQFFDGRNPVGQTIELGRGQNKRAPATIVGYISDARYDDMRETIRPTVYVPMRSLNDKDEPEKRSWITIMVKTQNANPLQIAPALRKEIAASGSGIRASNIQTEEELVDAKVVRERMLATLSLFFAGVALILAAVGLYGVLDYSVVQLRREIGIRLALGAQADKIVRRVTTEVFSMLALGSAIGLVLGVVSERYVSTLLYQVKSTELSMLLFPVLTILGASLLAALPPVVRALRIDPATMLRAE